MTTVEETAEPTYWAWVGKAKGWIKHRYWWTKNHKFGLPLIRNLVMGLVLAWAKYYAWVTVAQRTRGIEAARSDTAKQGLKFDHKLVERRDDMADRRMKLSLAFVVAFVIGNLIAWFVLRDNVIFTWEPLDGPGSRWLLWNDKITPYDLIAMAAIVGTVVGLTLVGWKHVPVPEPEEMRPVSPLEAGMAPKMLQAGIKEILKFNTTAQGIDITFHETRFIRDDGIEFDVHLTDKLTDEHLRTLERRLQAGENMISLVANRKNTAAPTLRIFWRDPLGDPVAPEERTPKSLSCQEPFYLTRDELGQRNGLSVLAHQLWTGGSGSGKSSALWILLDWLVDCRDADVYGIDIGGTVFGPYRRVMQRVARTGDEAVEMLREVLSIAEHRVDLLNDKMDADEGGIDDENWVITENKGERAIFVIIDEFAKIASNDEVRELVDQIYETGRKAAVYMIVSTPGADKERAKTNSPLHHSMIKVLFSTPISMITTLLGKGAIESGWRPDKLRPGSKFDPADAGKCYINAPEFPVPVLQRFDRLTPKNIATRNRQRKEHSASAITLPEPLRILQAAFAENGNPDRLPTETILLTQLADGWKPERLSQALKDLDLNPAVEPGKYRFGSRSGISGYEWGPIKAAIEAQR